MSVPWCVCPRGDPLSQVLFFCCLSLLSLLILIITMHTHERERVSYVLMMLSHLSQRFTFWDERDEKGATSSSPPCPVGHGARSRVDGVDDVGLRRKSFSNDARSIASALRHPSRRGAFSIPAVAMLSPLRNGKWGGCFSLPHGPKGVFVVFFSLPSGHAQDVRKSA